MILYLAADLLWATRIKSTADALGLQARPVRNLEMLHARLADSPVRALIVDLEAPDTALALITRLRTAAATPAELAIRIVAFGPHVATDALHAARQAGADTVLPRGAFAANLPGILQSLAAPAPPASA